MHNNFIQETVSALLLFGADYDPYNYADADIEKEAQSLFKALETGDVEPIREHLLSFAEESDNVDLIETACELARRLDVIASLQKRTIHLM